MPPVLARQPARGGRRPGGRLGGAGDPAAARRLAGRGDLVPRPGRRVPARPARAGVRPADRRGLGGTRLAVRAGLGDGGRPDGGRGRRGRVGRGAFGPDPGRRGRRRRGGAPGLAGGNGPARPGAGAGRPGLVPAARTRRPGLRRTGLDRLGGRVEPDPGTLDGRLAGPGPGRGRGAGHGGGRGARAGPVPPGRGGAARGGPAVRPGAPGRRLAQGLTRYDWAAMTGRGLDGLAAARLWATDRFPYLATGLVGAEVVAAPGSGAVAGDESWRMGAGPGLTAGRTAGQPARPAWQADLLRRQVAQDVIAHAKQAGNVPGGLLRWAEEILSPKVNWRKVLAAELRRAVAEVSGAVDYSYRRPSRRAAVAGNVVLPALRRPVPDVAGVCDTSGSMTEDPLAAAPAEGEGLRRAPGLARQGPRPAGCYPAGPPRPRPPPPPAPPP